MLTLDLQGMNAQAVVLFQRMEEDGIEPNLLMLNTLLNSFAVTGKWEEASQVLAYMKENVRMSAVWVSSAVELVGWGFIKVEIRYLGSSC